MKRSIPVMMLIGVLLAAVPVCATTPEAQQLLPTDEAMADLEFLVPGNTGFAARLYAHLVPGATNLFFSPLSISMAVGMVSAGARGETLSQIEATMGFSLDQSRLHPAFNGLDWLLEARQDMPEGFGEGFTLHLVNSLWGQVGHEFLPAFLGILGDFYGAGMRWTDFATDPDLARRTINAWVEEMTNDRIVELLKPAHITAQTLLTLVNAVYFNAPWAFPFDPEDTEPGPFTLLDGSQDDVPMMHQTEVHRYTRGDDYESIELDYNGNDLSMLIVVPDEGVFTGVESRLSAPFLEALDAALTPEHVILTMPKFTFEWGDAIDSPLQAMGMVDAFDGSAADFSGMDGGRDLFIGSVIHKAFVAVDEAGTEAAAATAIVMVGSAMTQPTYHTVTIDRPFLFLIRDNDTGAILFLGRVLDPRGESAS